MGAATWPPTPPPSTSTAKASEPRNPMNQAWVAGGSALPNSAVPVLPATSWPATAADVPVPVRTTSRMRSARMATVAGSRATGATGRRRAGDAGRPPRPRRHRRRHRGHVQGAGQHPSLADGGRGPVGGVARVGELPARRVHAGVVVDAEAEAAGGGDQVGVGQSSSARVTKAVLHEWAKAVRKGIGPERLVLEVLERLAADGGHRLAGDGGLGTQARRRTRASDVTTLKLDPGGYWPSRARLKGWSRGRAATARTSPVGASMATMAAGWTTPARARSAASCTRGSRVRTSGSGGVPGNWASDGDLDAGLVHQADLARRQPRQLPLVGRLQARQPDLVAHRRRAGRAGPGARR